MNKTITPYRPKILSSQDEHMFVIPVNTNLSQSNSGETKYWIRIRRNNLYTPYKPNIQSHLNPTESHSHSDDWMTVASKKKDKPIYYWVVDSHNLFDRRDKSYRLYFTEPDSTQIENMDQTNYMAIDSHGQLRLLHSQLKHNNMKMNPTFYISRTIKQIEDALQFVKYCVVKVENNEQKLIEDSTQLLNLTPTINHQTDEL